MIRARSGRHRPAVRRGRWVAAAALIVTGAGVWAGLAPLLGGHSSARLADATSAATGVPVWDWRQHPGMGATLVSGPVTHPSADHAGAGLERLGVHRQVIGTGVRAASSAVRGLDVSAYQPSINWSAVHTSGGQFAYIKATEGTGYTSPSFAAQYDGSFGAAVIRGAYHFALPDRSGGATQADYFINHGGGWSADDRTLPGALDIEYNPYGPECYGLSHAGMVGWIWSFAGEYQARTARWPAIYSTTDWWATCTGNYGGFARFDPLWIACYCGGAGTIPAGWPTYTFWQYADSGTFPGDQDVFNGDTGGLLRLAGGAATKPAAVAGAAGGASVYVRGTNRGAYGDSLPAAGQWSGLRALGGTWPANVAALATASGSVFVFGVGTTGHLYADVLRGGTWSGWQTIGSANGGFQGVPTAVQDHSGTVRVYVRSTAGSLYEAHLPPGGRWSTPWNMGGRLPDNPAALAGSSGYVWVFGIGTDRALYERHLVPGGSWSGWDRIGGSVTGVPAPTQDHSGIIRVYAPSTAGNLYEAHLAPGGRWTTPWNMGGRLADSAAALTSSTGQVWVFGVGLDRALYDRHLVPGGSWTVWHRTGGSVTGVPAAIQDHGGTIRVYARGANATLQEFRLPAGGDWSGPSTLTGPLF